MPKGLYYTAVFSCIFSFFRRLISESLNGSQPNLDTYSFMTAIWKIWSELLRAFTDTESRTRGKTLFWGPTLNFDRTYCNETWYQQLERNLSIYRDSPTCTPNLVNFGPETAENGWRVFAHPLHLRIGDTASLTARMLYNRFATFTPIPRTNCTNLPI